MSSTENTKAYQPPVPKASSIDGLVVAIIGGGIGGIALAVSLQQRDIEVAVFEADDHFAARRQGYGLTMQQAGSAIRQLGIDLPNDAPSTSHYTFATDGTILGYYGRAFRQRTEGEEPKKKPRNKPSTANIHIPRQQLRLKLLDQLRPGTIRWGSKFSHYEQLDSDAIEGSQVVTHFADGSSFYSSILIGADGIWSKVREQMLSDVLTYLDVIVILGIVRSEHPLVRERVFETVDGSTRLYSMPFTSDLSMWQLSFPCTEQHAKSFILDGSRQADPGLLKEEALRRCGSWHAPVPEMINDTSLENMSGGAVYDRPCLTTAMLGDQSHRNVSLLGDAAHPMSPFKGQGANQALLDAVSFGRCVDQVIVEDARNSRRPEPRLLPQLWARVLHLYEPEMTTRSAVKVIASRECAIHQHSSDATCTKGENETKTAILAALSQQHIGAASAVARPKEVEGPVGMQISTLDEAVLNVAGENPGGCSSSIHRRLISPIAGASNDAFQAPNVRATINSSADGC